MARGQTIATWILAGLGALAFFFAGIAKAMGTPIVDMIHETIGAPVWMLRVIGGIEFVSAGLLMWPKARWYAAVVLADIVFVAAVWHFVAGDPSGSVGAIVNLVLMSALAWIDRPGWFRSRFF